MIGITFFLNQTSSTHVVLNKKIQRNKLSIGLQPKLPSKVVQFYFKYSKGHFRWNVICVKNNSKVRSMLLNHAEINCFSLSYSDFKFAFSTFLNLKLFLCCFVVGHTASFTGLNWYLCECLWIWTHIHMKILKSPQSGYYQTFFVAIPKVVTVYCTVLMRYSLCY